MSASAEPRPHQILVVGERAGVLPTYVGNNTEVWMEVAAEGPLPPVPRALLGHAKVNIVMGEAAKKLRPGIVLRLGGQPQEDPESYRDDKPPQRQRPPGGKLASRVGEERGEVNRLPFWWVIGCR